MCFWRLCRRPDKVCALDALVMDSKLVEEVLTTLDHTPQPPPPPPPLSVVLPQPPPTVYEKRETVSRTSHQTQNHWSFSEPSSSSSHEDDDDEEEEVDPSSSPSSSASSSSESDEHDEENDDDEEEEEEEDLLGWHEHTDGDMVAPLYNIYLDENTMSVRFNTLHQETRETLSEQIVKNYVQHTIASGNVICRLQDVIAGVTLPTDASHMIATFCNFAGDQFSVPFALDHPNDPFPFEDTSLITDCQLDDLPQTLVLIHQIDGQGPVMEENLTQKMIHFCWKYFQPGFFHHRPYAWTWLSELSEDPEAILQAKYDGDRFACLKLSTAELIVYSI